MMAVLNERDTTTIPQRKVPCMLEYLGKPSVSCTAMAQKPATA